MIEVFSVGIDGPITRKVFVDLIEAFKRGQVRTNNIVFSNNRLDRIDF